MADAGVETQKVLDRLWSDELWLGIGPDVAVSLPGQGRPNAWLLMFELDKELRAVRLRSVVSGHGVSDIDLRPPVPVDAFGQEVRRDLALMRPPVLCGTKTANSIWRTLFEHNRWLAARVGELFGMSIAGGAEEKQQSGLWRLTPNSTKGIQRAFGIAGSLSVPPTTLMLLAGICREAHLEDPKDAAAQFLRWISRERRVPLLPKLTDSMLVVLLHLPFTSLESAEATDLAPLAGILDRADEIRQQTGDLEDIDTRHLLAALLLDGDLDGYFRGLGLSPRDARRIVVSIAVDEGDDRAKWHQALLASFDIDHVVSRDTWTVDDKLGYEIYADAISRSILNGTTKPPLTIGIQAPWGHGKTSLMRMIQKRLDPKAPDQEGRTHITSVRSAVNTTYEQLLSWSRKRPEGPMLSKDDVPLPSVWFNPLYYRETSQIWAGLAHAMLHQLVGRLKPPDRELFWFRLQQSRINVGAIRSDFYNWVMARFVPAGVVWLTIVIVCALAGVVWPWAFAGSGGGIIAALVHFFARKSTEKEKIIDRPFERYVTEPNYQSELGLLHLIDHDLDGALSLLIGDDPDRSISVFIDDLDRCDPQTVNQVVLAINQFLSLPRRNVFFFLGMDMEMVAAALEQAQKETLGSVAGPTAYRRSYGWRFMEKFVQLPFVIPHLDEKTASVFAEAHLTGSGTGAGEAPSQTLARVIADVQRSSNAESLVNVAIPDDLPPREKLAAQLEKSKRAAELMTDKDSDEMKRLVELALQDLELNPRTIVRYFCLVRILRNIQFANQTATRRPDHDRLLVVRAAHLLMNWPQFVQWLRNNPRIFAGGTAWKSSVEAMEELAGKSNDHPSWANGLRELLQETKEPPAYLADVSLYDYLRDLSKDGPGLKAMYDARFF